MQPVLIALFEAISGLPGRNLYVVIETGFTNPDLLYFAQLRGSCFRICSKELVLFLAAVVCAQWFVRALDPCEQGCGLGNRRRESALENS